MVGAGGRIDDHHGAAARGIGDRGIPGGAPDVGGARERRDAEDVEVLRVVEQPEAALLRFQRRARQIGIGERRPARHDARDQRVAAAVDEILLHGVAERQLGGQRAELRLELGKAAHDARRRDRPGRRRAHERGHGRGNAGDDVRTPGRVFDVDPGSHGVRHGSPPATVTAAREQAA
jgi:hypothetical protein